MSANDLTKQALQALFLSFPSQERTDNERELVKVYLMAVEDIGRDFIAMACKRFIAGLVERPSLTFRPTPAELAVECRRLRDKAAKSSVQPPRLPDGSNLVPERGVQRPFIPYPKLWDALEGEPDLLRALKAETFDGMTALSKLFATEGLEDVRYKLRPIASAPARHKAGEAA